MEYYRDYLMRRIAQITALLAGALLGKYQGETTVTLPDEAGNAAPLRIALQAHLQSGQAGPGEDALFDAIASGVADAADVLWFYSTLNAHSDAALAQMNFPRMEVLHGLRDAIAALNLDILPPEEWEI